jgi:hypothetical protein
VPERPGQNDRAYSRTGDGEAHAVSVRRKHMEAAWQVAEVEISSHGLRYRPHPLPLPLDRVCSRPVVHPFYDLGDQCQLQHADNRTRHGNHWHFSCLGLPWPCMETSASFICVGLLTAHHARRAGRRGCGEGPHGRQPQELRRLTCVGSHLAPSTGHIPTAAAPTPRRPQSLVETRRSGV